MRKLAVAVLAWSALFLFACGEPLPQDKLDYAGEWQGPQVYLLITPAGRCVYERRRDAGNVSIDAPIQRFEGDNFLVGLGPLTTTFVVSKPPAVVDGKWRMTVDGVELTRVSSPGEVSA